MQNWALFVNGSNVDTITQGERVGFDEGAGIDLAFDGNDITISHQDTSNFGGYTSTGDSSLTTMSFVRDIALGLDTFGHVTSGSATQGTFTLGDGVTTITASSAGISLTGDSTWSANQTAASTFNIAHADTSNQVSVDNTGNNVIQDITLDTFGHITGLISTNITTVTNAAKLYTTATNSVGPYYPTMAGAYGNAYYDHYTDANFSYNASTNVLSAVTFSGALSGNATSASHATKVQSTYTNDSTTMYINGTPTLGTASKDMYHTNAIYMTPSNDYLYAARFVGPLTGAVTGNASTSTQVYVTSTATSTDYRLIFGEANDGGNGYESLYKDSGASLYYNPSTNRLYAEHIQGEGSLITNINYSNIYNPPTIPTVGNGSHTITENSAYMTVSNSGGTFTANDSGNTTDTITLNAATASTINTVVARDASGDINARLFRSEYDSTNASIGYIMTQVNTGADNYMRPSTPAQLKSTLGLFSAMYGYNNGSGGGYQFASGGTASTGNMYFDAQGGIDIGQSTNFGGTGKHAMTISHSDTSSQGSVNNTGRTYIQDITLDGYGHITSISSATETVTNTDTNTTYSAGAGLDISGTSFSLETDLRGNASLIGYGNSDYIQFNNYTTDFRFGGNIEFQMQSDGDFHADGDIIAYSTSTSSDAKLKTNIKTVEHALDKVCALDGVTFDWIRDGKESAGVIAQNVEEVLPRAVKEVKDLNGDDTHKIVDYNQLSALFIEAIKELKDENKELRSMIEDLKSINS
jgi:hypothetical protein